MTFFWVHPYEKGLSVEVSFSSLEKRSSVISHLPMWIARHFVSSRHSLVSHDFILLSSRELYENVPCERDLKSYVADAFALANCDSIMPTLAY